MKVLVNGIGNIGTCLLNILVDFKDILNISEIYALKNTEISPWIESDLSKLKAKGIKICTKEGSEDMIGFDKISSDIDYIFDCTANTFGMQNKEWYYKLPNLKACSAQGSEKGFGIPYMAGINDSEIKNQKFAHIVSCNTHAIASIISAFGGNNINNLEKADFVIVRRSEDLGNHQRLVSANVVSRHRDKTYGTHHATDAIDLFKTLGHTLTISSSDITTPSQLMHTVRFNIDLKNKIPISELEDMINLNPYISFSSKFDSNVIFEAGRRYSKYGRIYSHAIVNHNNIMLNSYGKNIKGWAFIPQEGNTILSTISAYLLQTNNNNYSKVFNDISNALIFKEW